MTQKYFKFLIITLAVAVILPQVALASWWNPMSWGIWNSIFHKSSGTACPQDAKVCPDGSSVGRVGPNCTFAICPLPAEKIQPTAPPPTNFIPTSKPPADISPVIKEQECTNDGGKVTSVTCYCSGPKDFYNSCLVGACTCNPSGGIRNTLKTCECPSGKCWNGGKCINRADAFKKN